MIIKGSRKKVFFLNNLAIKRGWAKEPAIKDFFLTFKNSCGGGEP